MWWFVAWAVVGLIMWLCFAVLLAGVPSSSRASNADVIKAGAISFGASALLVTIAFGVWSALRGIF